MGSSKIWYEEGECAYGCVPLEAFYRGVRADIDDIGWSVVAVYGSPEAPPWAYTVGLLEGFDHPELTVIGLEPHDAHGLLNHFGFSVRDGERLVADLETRHEIHGRVVKLAPVHRSHWKGSRFNQWHGFYEEEGWGPPDPVAIQVLWAAAAGRFPGDPGSAKFSRRQPLLSRPPVSAN